MTTFKNKLLFGLLILCPLLLLTACGSGDKEAQAEKEEDPFNLESESNEKSEDGLTSGINELQGALDEMKNAVNQLQENNGDGKKIEVVDFRKLKEMMPERIGDLKRVSNGGEKAGMLGIKVSQAEAEYKGDNDSRMEISIVDVGGMSMAITGLASWSAVEVDRESDDEIERTTTIDGHKAYEKYNFKTRSGETNLVVDKRFIVNIKGQNIKREDMARAREKLGLDRLEGR